MGLSYIGVPLFVTLCVTLHTVLSLTNFSSALSGQPKSYIFNHLLEQKANADGVRQFFYGVLWNVLLVALFVLQHSGMASSWWKSRVSLFRSMGLERITYVVASNYFLTMLTNNWTALPVAPLWYIDTSERFLLWLFFAVFHVVMWIAIYGATVCADIPELLGYTEFYNYWNGIQEEPLGDKSMELQRLLRHMRHPGTTCFLLILWIYPLMTWQRFIGSLMLTIYVLCGFSVTHEDHVYAKRSWFRKTLFVTTETIYVSEK